MLSAGKGLTGKAVGKYHNGEARRAFLGARNHTAVYCSAAVRERATSRDLQAHATVSLNEAVGWYAAGRTTFAKKFLYDIHTRIQLTLTAFCA